SDINKRNNLSQKKKKRIRLNVSSLQYWNNVPCCFNFPRIGEREGGLK
ncbi:6752_t:CDS:1, partial [Gigaspora rosea]